MESISIGTLAKRAGVGIDTVRCYEKAGLLAPKARLASPAIADARILELRGCDSFAALSHPALR